MRHRSRNKLWWLLSLCAGSSAGCGSSTFEFSTTGGILDVLVVDGLVRAYQGFLPDAFDPTQPIPVVFVLHDVPSRAAEIRLVSRMDAVADRLGVVVIYPEAAGDWAEGCGCTQADLAEVDDVSFIRTVLDTLSVRFSVDQDRVYAVGFGEGGLMTHRLGCELSDRLSGIGVVAATMSVPLSEVCDPPPAVPVVMVVGTEDPLFPIDGRLDVGVRSTLSAAAAAAHWAGVNVCVGDPTVSAIDSVPEGATGVQLELYETCDQGTTVAMYRIEGGGHDWPTSSFNAGEIITEFLLSHQP